MGRGASWLSLRAVVTPRHHPVRCASPRRGCGGREQSGPEIGVVLQTGRGSGSHGVRVHSIESLAPVPTSHLRTRPSSRIRSGRGACQGYRGGGRAFDAEEGACPILWRPDELGCGPTASDRVGRAHLADGPALVTGWESGTLPLDCVISMNYNSCKGWERDHDRENFDS